MELLIELIGDSLAEAKYNSLKEEFPTMDDSWIIRNVIRTLNF